MNMKELGFYLYMESEERKQKELEEDRKVNVGSNNNWVWQQAAHKENEEDDQLIPKICPPA